MKKDKSIMNQEEICILINIDIKEYSNFKIGDQIYYVDCEYRYSNNYLTWKTDILLNIQMITNKEKTYISLYGIGHKNEQVSKYLKTSETKIFKTKKEVIKELKKRKKLELKRNKQTLKNEITYHKQHIKDKQKELKSLNKTI